MDNTPNTAPYTEQPKHYLQNAIAACNLHGVSYATDHESFITLYDDGQPVVCESPFMLEWVWAEVTAQ